MAIYKLKPMATNEDKIKYWEQVFADFKRSGLCRAVYCRKHHIAHSTFYTWQKKVEARPSKFNNVKNQQKSSKLIDFVPVTVSNSKSSTQIKDDSIANKNNVVEIIFPSDVKLIITQDADITHLAEIINILR